MALSDLSRWNKMQSPVSACGAGDNNASNGSAEEKPAVCGSACGAGDKPAEKPAACGAADNNASGESVEEKPAACGSACGAGDK